MARAVISDPKRRTACEPLYDIDPQTGASVEIFGVTSPRWRRRRKGPPNDIHPLIRSVNADTARTQHFLGTPCFA